MIVITGSSGQLATLVVGELRHRVAPTEVLLGSRTPEKLNFRESEGFKVTRIDLDDVASLDAAFKGADQVLLVSTDGPNELRLVQHGNAIEAAKRAGVKRVVYTSFQNPSEDSLCSLNRLHAATEAMIVNSGLTYTFLRNGQYAENLAMSVPMALTNGVVAQPGTLGKVAYSKRADIAQATAAALTNGDIGNKVYELSGPEALSAVDIAQLLSDAAGKPIQPVEMDPEQYAGMMAANGLPPFLVEAMIGMFAANAAGEFEATSNDIERLTGKKAVSASQVVTSLAK